MALPKLQTSSKHLAIVKANARIVSFVGAASFIAIFCLVASKSVISQNQYLSRVIAAKQKAHSQLVKNIAAADNLLTSYKTFVSSANNAIGGNTFGSGQNDGDNAKLVLDALPSQYDFPALTASLEDIFGNLGIKNGGITGTDDQIAQQTNAASNNPKPVSVPFSLSASSISYDNAQQLIAKLQSSIRPMQVDTLDLSGATNSMTLTLTMNTYYQPGKSLTITKETVK